MRYDLFLRVFSASGCGSLELLSGTATVMTCCMLLVITSKITLSAVSSNWFSIFTVFSKFSDELSAEFSIVTPKLCSVCRYHGNMLDHTLFDRNNHGNAMVMS